jgi:predicted phosphoadenosine phosphosulfate sulfurtransferase
MGFYKFCTEVLGEYEGRVFHSFNRWEDAKNGMYDKKRLREPVILLCYALLRSDEMFTCAMNRALNEWPYSSEHNLSNRSLNRKAWLGHAACNIEFGANENEAIHGYRMLTKNQQEKANETAKRIIDHYELLLLNTMPKRYLEIDVLTAAKERIAWTFDNFEKVYVSFSGGKDSTVMLHLVADEAKKRGKKFGLLFVDLEGQYNMTIEHILECFKMYAPITEQYWCSLPIHLRNAVSVYEPHWICWDEEKRESWIRVPPEIAITDQSHFPFFHKGMEFEEFVPMFGEWYSEGKETACFVGIRTDESLNRYRTISSQSKVQKQGKQFTTKVTDSVFNVYPIYDWRTEDIWTYHAKNTAVPANRLYDVMYRAGLTISQMRICQPYGDDQRRGLWLFHLIEPETWGKVVARVNGANGGALYVQESGNITGYRKVSKPEGHTWKSFALLLLSSMPPKTKEHYENKVYVFERWWKSRGYPDGIPDEAPYELEASKKAPSWRRVCKSLLRNDYWCKGLSFTQHKSEAYEKYLALIKKKRSND